MDNYINGQDISTLMQNNSESLNRSNFLREKREHLTAEIIKAKSLIQIIDDELFGSGTFEIQGNLIPKSISNDTIIDSVCNHYDTSWHELYRLRHRRLHSNTTHTIWYLLHRRGGMTYQEIGAMFERRHCTVIQGVRKIENYIRYDKNYREKLNDIIGDILKRHDCTFINMPQ